MDKILYILRGVPGSGKSTVARTLSPFHYEADQFFMKNGKYDFDIRRLHDAHVWCKNRVESALKDGYPKVVVSNTSTTEKEIQPYIDLGETYGYTVISLIVENRHGGVNEHDVPDAIIKKMKQRFSIKL